METTRNHFFYDISVMLGRSMRHVFAQHGHDRHGLDYADRDDAAVRLCVRRRDPGRNGQLCELPAAGHPADCDWQRNSLHGLPSVYRQATGLFERFHSMPMSRSSLLWAHVLTSLVSNAISVVVIILVALIMGFRSSAGVLEWLAVAGILMLFTLALTWVAAIAGLTANSVEGASAFSYPLIFLPFISSAFVPTASMPPSSASLPRTSRLPRSLRPSRPAVGNR